MDFHGTNAEVSAIPFRGRNSCAFLSSDSGTANAPSAGPDGRSSSDATGGAKPSSDAVRLAEPQKSWPGARTARSSGYWHSARMATFSESLGGWPAGTTVTTTTCQTSYASRR